MLTQANEIRRVQSSVSTMALADLNEIFRLVDGLGPEAALDLVIDLLPGVAQTYGDVAAVAAGEWFEDLRVREVGVGRPAALASPVPTEQVTQSTRFAAQHLFTARPDLMEKYLAGQLLKWVSQPARETVINSIDADPIGYGWQRVVRPDGCGFCRMLADRGGVYTRKKVWFASHANCNCGVVPSWDPSLPEVSVNAYEASKRMESVRRRAAGPPSKKQKQAQAVLDRHRARTRAWVQDFEDAS